MASGLRDFTITFGTRILVMLVAVATQSCLAWLLGTAGRGSYAICLVFAQLLRIFCALGFDTASGYFVAARKHSVSEGVVYTLVYGTVASVAAFAVGMLVMRLPLEFFAKASPETFQLALLMVPAIMFPEVLKRIIVAEKRFGWNSILTLANELSVLGLVVGFVWVLGWGVQGALWAMIAAGALNTLMTLAYLRAGCGARFTRPSVRGLWQMLEFGTRYYVGKISNVLNLQIGTIILAFFATREEIGLFAVAAALAERISMVPDALTEVLFPRVAGAEQADGRSKLVAQCVRMTALLCGAVLLVLAVLATPIVSVLFSPAFLPAAGLIRIIAIGVLARCACKVFVPYLVGTNRPGIASFAVAAGVAVNLGLLWVLMPRIGLAGAALAMTMSYLVSSAILAGAFQRFSGLSQREIWQLRRSDWGLLNDTWQRIRRKVLPTSNAV